MHRILSFLLLLSTCYIADAQVDKRDTTNYTVKIKIPTEWIEKIRHFNYTRNTTGLLKEFDHFIRPDSLVNPHAKHVNRGYGRVLSALFVDLDGQPGDELICLLGWDVNCPYLSVFKEKQGNWYLIYLEEIESFYSSPALCVANCFSPNKTFYCRRVYNHGSGEYADGYSFYKLINNKVYKCLNLLNKAEIINPGPYMSQAIKMDFEFSGDDQDGIWVNYNYNFYNVPWEKDDSLPVANEGIPLIKGEGGTNYTWNKKSLTYDLDMLPFQNELEDLTAEKIACFGEVWKNTLFVRAFQRQIDEMLKTGTPQQKMVLKEYLAQVEKDQGKLY